MTVRPQRKSSMYGSAGKRHFDIIRGAIENDVEEVRGAVEIDATSVNYQEPGTLLTALHRAAARGNMDVIRWLANRPDLDPMITDRFGRTAARMATRFGQDEALQILLPLTYPRVFPPTP